MPTMSPQQYMNKINEWVDAELDTIQLRLIIAELSINEIVNISQFEPEVRGGEVGDIYFSIAFRTHKPLLIRYIDNSQSSYQGGLIDYGNRYFGDDTYSDGDKIKIVITATVYEEDSQNSTGLGYAYEGETYTVYSQWGEWVQIYYGVAGGWVHRGFITKA